MFFPGVRDRIATSSNCPDCSANASGIVGANLESSAPIADTSASPAAKLYPSGRRHLLVLCLSRVTTTNRGISPTWIWNSRANGQLARTSYIARRVADGNPLDRAAFPRRARPNRHRLEPAARANVKVPSGLRITNPSRGLRAFRVSPSAFEVSHARRHPDGDLRIQAVKLGFYKLQKQYDLLLPLSGRRVAAVNRDGGHRSSSLQCAAFAQQKPAPVKGAGHSLNAREERSLPLLTF